MNYKIKDFALLEGKIVQIIRIKLNDNKTHMGGNAIYEVQVRLHNDNLKHWVDSRDLQPFTDQKAPKVLYS